MFERKEVFEGNLRAVIRNKHWDQVGYYVQGIKNLNGNINAQDQFGMTALHEAVDKKNLLTVKYLLEQGADPMIPDMYNMLPLESCTTFMEISQTHIIIFDVKQNTFLGYVKPHEDNIRNCLINHISQQYLLDSNKEKNPYLVFLNSGKILYVSEEAEIKKYLDKQQRLYDLSQNLFPSFT